MIILKLTFMALVGLVGLFVFNVGLALMGIPDTLAVLIGFMLCVIVGASFVGFLFKAATNIVNWLDRHNS